jgi:hypothetical protein
MFPDEPAQGVVVGPVITPGVLGTSPAIFIVEDVRYSGDPSPFANCKLNTVMNSTISLNTLFEVIKYG